MKIRYIVAFIAIVLALIGSADLANRVSAQGAANIQYPVGELGGCKSKTDCKTYCDKPANANACLDFAQKNNLMSAEEIGQAKKFLAAGSKGPGGCVGRDSCESYCNDISHIDECISYAENNNLMSAKDLEEAKKIKAAIDKGIKPPNCKNKEECDAYCEDPNHMEECITFGVAAGFIQGKELEDSQKMLVALKKGVKPLPCKGKDACDQYCSSPDNMEACISFAMEAGMMTEQEKADSQKMLAALKKGVKPPNCRGKEECDAYCSQEQHSQECIDFSEAAGFMTPEGAAMARKTGGKGPGGCKSKDECDAFCNNPDNQETCFNFVSENGMIPEAELKQIQEGKQRFKESIDQAPQAVIDCLNSQFGSATVEKFKNGTAMPPREAGDKMQGCFGQMGRESGEPGAGGMIPPAGQSGPGGCKTAEECKKYCEANPNECQKFQPGPGTANPAGQIMPQQSGPGGCRGPDECKTYCESHSEECKNFQSREDQGPVNDQTPGDREPQESIEGQMPQGQPCAGENCQGPSLQLQPGQNIQEGRDIRQIEGQMPQGQQSPSSQPGGGGDIPPGEAVPLVQPAEQQPPSSEIPPPSSFIINTDSLVGSLIYATFRLLIGK